MTDQYIESVSINWDRIDRNSYLRDIESLRGLQSIQFHKPVTFFVGENGTGKSTMLEAIAVAMGFNAEGGSKNYRFSTYDSHSELYDAIRVSKGCRTDFADIQNKKECGGNRQWQNHYLRNWAANTKGKGII